MPFNEGWWWGGGAGTGTGQRHTVTLLWKFLLLFSAFKLSYSFFYPGCRPSEGAALLYSFMASDGCLWRVCQHSNTVDGGVDIVQHRGSGYELHH